MARVDRGNMPGGRTPKTGDEASRRPRTKKGEATRAKILDAARMEFGQNGFADTSIVAITQRAEVALGTFYTYFTSKEEVFGALVSDMSRRVAGAVAPAIAGIDAGLAREQAALRAFLHFVREKAEVYRIIDEAEFVDPDGYERHYRTTAARMRERLDGAADLAPPESDLDAEVRAWAVMGMNVFLGLRFALWGDEDPEAVAASANRLLAKGIG